MLQKSVLSNEQNMGCKICYCQLIPSTSQPSSGYVVYHSYSLHIPNGWGGCSTEISKEGRPWVKEEDLTSDWPFFFHGAKRRVVWSVLVVMMNSPSGSHIKSWTPSKCPEITRSGIHCLCNENDITHIKINNNYQEECCKTKHSRWDHKIKAVSQSTTLSCNIQKCILSFEIVTIGNFQPDSLMVTVYQLSCKTGR